MCPEQQILSLYFDKELPSPWKEKMENHLDQCVKCRQRLDSLGLLVRAEICVPTDVITTAQERGWKILQEKTGMNSDGAEQSDEKNISSRNQRQNNVWKRRISIPIPAAAAILLMAAFAVLWAFTARSQSTAPNMLASEEYSLWPSGPDTGFETAGFIPLTDLNGVLQYLGARDSGDIVVLRLPESRNFSSSGGPAIIKAADYSRRKP
jgi:hypothetical protein